MITILAHAKINWAIDILCRRADGLHMLDSLMETVNLVDTLTCAPAREITLTVARGDIEPGDGNLIVRAANALNAHTGNRFGATMTLDKRIPVQAGLGGGSADAAAALIALNELWHLSLSQETLLQIGYELGCDVPFMLVGGLARVGGTGEAVCALDDATPLNCLIVKPDAGLSTGAVFKRWDETGETLGCAVDDVAAARIGLDMAALSACARNALEAPATAMLPEIAFIKETLVYNGALFASMSGSGSAVFAAFASARDAAKAAQAFRQQTFVVKTVSRTKC